jgi:ATP-dependent Clp protease adaptor protein ClpS
MSTRAGTKTGSGTEVLEKPKSKVKRPRQYQVVLLNDDYTSMDFVVAVLESIFQKSPAEAVQIMLSVHHKGSGVCGVYTKEIAEAKVEAVHRKARENGFPLKATMEAV